MKKYIIALVTILTAAMFVCCDKIEGPYITLNDTEEVTVEFPELDLNTVYRKVLIEEYTGHRCPNCPAGHDKLNELHEIFGDTLIPVGIHATTLAAPTAEFPNDFRTEVGTELANLYNIDGIPAAIINRGMEIGGFGPQRWLTKINAVDRSKVYAAIQVINQNDAAQADLFKINVKVTMMEDYSSPLRLSLFLVEDGIVSPQIRGTEVIEDYVHNHMLRMGINGTFGELLTVDGILQKGADYKLGRKLDISGKGYNADNCYVVAMLYDKNNNEVLQVERVKLK